MLVRILTNGLVQFAVHSTISMSVGTVVNNVVEATMPIGMSRGKHLQTVVGGYVLSSLVGGIAGSYVVGQMNTIAAAIDRTVEGVEDDETTD